MTSFHIEDLPERLSIRTRVVGESYSSSVQGHHVLCWLQHAWRVEENPALEVASRAAIALSVPLVVYAELQIRNARHWMFSLEGLRDFAQQLEAKGQRLLVSTPRGEGGGRPSLHLGCSSSLVVTEDLCGLPESRFSRFWKNPETDWYGNVDVACVWAVDSACLVPLGTLAEKPSRAFQFRVDTASARAREISRSWPSIDLAGPASIDELRVLERRAGSPWQCSGEFRWDGFVDLADATDVDLRRLVQRGCLGDRGLPIGDTRGGTSAGYARWEAFRDGPIHRYHELRDDAAIGPNGEEGSRAAVSRMSAYFHYGMVSPFRIAREADELSRAGSDGAKKFLDELLVWRELAHHWMHHGGHAHPGHLPPWAQETLEAHRHDSRQALLSEHTLARGQTGVELWDLAQLSLLRHGELHNNLRMTWGKAIIGWTESSECALRMLRTLNDEYALDGSDPSSYGGLMWCLGLFDRPFQPERPVLGTVRPREVEGHAERLDLERYRRVVGRLQPGRPRTVGVIGAGVSGLVAARVLADHGVAVTVFEKARGPGGRMSTRRTDVGRFDHGCGSFSGAYTLPPDALVEWALRDEQSGPGYRGANALAKDLAADLEQVMPSNDQEPSRVRYQTRVGRLERSADRWRLFDDSESELGEFDGLVVTAPPPQTSDLLRAINPSEADRIASIKTYPQWTAMVGLEIASGFDERFMEFSSHPVLDRAILMPNTADESGERWVVHANARWTTEHLEREKNDAAELLWAAFSKELKARCYGVSSRTLLLGHRWRYAYCESEEFVDPIAPGLVVAGDWACARGWRADLPLTLAGVSRAYLSGCSAAMLLCLAYRETPANGP